MRRRSHVPDLLVAAAMSVTGGAAFAQPAEPDGIALRLETELREQNLSGGAQRPTFARGDTVSGRARRETTLEGHAEIRRAGTVIRADRLTLYEADDEVIAVGNVRVAREGQVFTGPQLQLSLDSGVGTFASPSYFLPLTGGRGVADRIDFLGRTELELTNATYTTCRPDDPDWYLRAETMSFDRTADEGSASWTTLYFKDVPVLATPYFAFPLGEQRRSGFLAPTLSLSNTVGGEVRLPFYWNIAPNRDFTLFTNMTGRRGLQFGGLARYLEPTASGITRFEYSPYDREAGRSRWMVDSSHLSTDVMGWQAGWTVRAVSDDQYFVDYSRSIVQSAERSLPRDVFAVRAFGDWLVRGRMLAYQNILEARNAPAYDRLPQFTVLNTQRDLRGFDVGFLGDATWFSRDLAGSAQGARMIATPSVSYPITGAAWFVTPKASLNATAYRLDVNPFGPNDINRVVPTFSLDSGLLFERTASFGGREVLQTLEPRLLYVYTPYHNQDQIPVFDSAVSNLNYATLFSEQLFVGGDRIANANQLTAGAISRFIDPGSGVESLRLAVAQRSYFTEQKVTIPGIPSRTDSHSDVMLVASGNLGGGHTLDAGVQLSVTDRSVPRFGATWRWWPASDRLLNVALRYQEYDYAQVDTSWRWPVSQRWNTLGRLNYSFLREQLDSTSGTIAPVNPQLLQGLVGLEYLADCWVLRLVANRYVTSSAQRTSTFFVQFELNGVGRIGLDPFDILTRNIPGYRTPLQRPSTPSRFFGYE